MKLEILKQLWHDLDRKEKIEFADWVSRDLSSELIKRYGNNGTSTPAH